MKNPEKATVLVEKMLDFAQVHGLMEAEDRCYTRNLLLDALGMAAPEGTVGTEPGELPPTLTPILEELTRMAAEAGLVDEGAEAREHFGVRLCGPDYAPSPGSAGAVRSPVPAGRAPGGHRLVPDVPGLRLHQGGSHRQEPAL